MFTYNKILPNILDLFALSLIPALCLITFLSGSGGLVFPSQSALIASHSMAALALVLTISVVAELILTSINGTVAGNNWHPVWHPIIVITCVSLTAPVLYGHCLAEPIVSFLINLLA